jgi:hypothetical protein
MKERRQRSIRMRAVAWAQSLGGAVDIARLLVLDYVPSGAVSEFGPRMLIEVALYAFVRSVPY